MPTTAQTIFNESTVQQAKEKALDLAVKSEGFGPFTRRYYFDDGSSLTFDGSGMLYRNA